MTLEQIDAKIAELEKQKKAELQKKKQKELLEQRRKNAKKRKLESRVKYILGGTILATNTKEKITEYIKEISSDLREQDKKTLEKYLANI